MVGAVCIVLDLVMEATCVLKVQDNMDKGNTKSWNNTHLPKI